jgi:hypothetical protein
MLFAHTVFLTALTAFLKRGSAFVAPLLVEEPKRSFVTVLVLPTTQTAGKIRPETGLAVVVCLRLLQVDTDRMIPQ